MPKPLQMEQTETTVGPTKTESAGAGTGSTKKILPASYATPEASNTVGLYPDVISNFLQKY